jgi:hypothetical protein
MSVITWLSAVIVGAIIFAVLMYRYLRELVR